MEIREEKAKIWRRDFEGKNGTFHKYTVSVSKKNQDGKYVNAYIPLFFTKNSGAPEKIENGTTCSIEGFMSVESFKDKDGNMRNTPQIVVMKVDFDDPTEGVDSFQQAEEDIPF